MTTVNPVTYIENQTISASSLNSVQASLESASQDVENDNVKKESLDKDAVSFTTLPVFYWATCQSNSNDPLDITTKQSITGTTITNVQSIYGSKNCTILPDKQILKGMIVRINFHWEVFIAAFTSSVTDRTARFKVRTTWTSAGVLDNPYNYGACHIGTFKKYDNAKTLDQGRYRTASWDGIFNVPSTDTLEKVELMFENHNGSGSDFTTKLGDGSMTVQVYNR